MKKSELVKAIAEGAGLNEAQASAALQAFVDSVTASLKRGDDVRLVGFGTFKAVKRAPGTSRNPRTGQVLQRAASKTARFQAGSGLKTTLSGPHGGGTGSDD